MKILLDHQVFSMQEYGGISRYFFETTQGLRKYEDVDIKCCLLFSNNEYVANKDLFSSHTFFKNVRFRGKRRIISLLNQVGSVQSLKQGRYDIFHPTYYDYYYSSIDIRKPIVLTCYDLIHEKFLTYDKKTIANKKLTLDRATKIIAISQNTKNDLIDHYNISPEKISVVYLASSLGNDRYEFPQFYVSENYHYFLFVGLRNEYKNFKFFVESISSLLYKHNDLYLYCAGGGSFTKEEIELFQQLKILNQIKYFNGSDESLLKLYSNAIAFFYPSLYEGFGIPLLEAMNCGCPVVASNTSSLPEVAQDAALYFDPTNKDSILFAAESILSDSTLRESLIKKGVERKNRFSWKKTASESYSIYKNLM